MPREAQQCGAKGGGGAGRTVEKGQAMACLSLSHSLGQVRASFPVSTSPLQLSFGWLVACLLI